MKWISVKDNLPEIEGRYFIMTTFHEPCISNERIVRENVPFVSNYTFKKGWMSQNPEFVITHWMPIPNLPSE